MVGPNVGDPGSLGSFVLMSVSESLIRESIDCDEGTLGLVGTVSSIRGDNNLGLWRSLDASMAGRSVCVVAETGSA